MADFKQVLYAVVQHMSSFRQQSYNRRQNRIDMCVCMCVCVCVVTHVVNR